MTAGTQLLEVLPVGSKKELQESSCYESVRWWLPKLNNIPANFQDSDEIAKHFKPTEDIEVLRNDLLMSTSIVPGRLHGEVRRSINLQKAAQEIQSKSKWLGSVTDILEDGFVAQFVTTSSDRKAIIAEFDFDELTPDDQEILQIGASLVWSIYTERRKGGLENSSTLYVRRTPRPTEKAINTSRDNLHEWFNDFGNESTTER